MDVQRMSFEQMQIEYQHIRQSWREQDDKTKREMMDKVQAIYRAITPGERGFMTNIHHLGQEIAHEIQIPDPSLRPLH